LVETAQTGAITLGSSTGAQTVNIGTGSGNSAINVATGSGGNTITIADSRGDTVTIHGDMVLDAEQINNTKVNANVIPTLMANSAARVSTSNATYNTTNWANNTWSAGTLSMPRGDDQPSNISIHYTAETDVAGATEVVHVTCNLSTSGYADTQDIKFGDYAAINQTFSAVFYKTNVTATSVPIRIGYRNAGGGTVGLTNQTIVVVAYPA